MEDILEVSSRSGFNARSWVLIKLCRCEGEEIGAPLSTTGLLDSQSHLGFGWKKLLPCLPRASPPHAQQAGGQTVETPASTELAYPLCPQRMASASPPPPNSTQGHLTGRASATSRVLITWESEIGLLFFSLVRWGRWKEVSMVVECKQHITLGLDTQMHGLPPSSGSSVLLGHFHHDYTLLTVLSKVLH